jgi:hypothetical protein
VSTSPAHTPVALMTARAETSKDSPERWSVSVTEVPVAFVAPTRVRMRAACCAAVRATAATSRASSINCPS